MSDLEMTDTQGCWVAVIGAVTQHLNVGSFVTQLNMTQPARLGESRPLYTFNGWTDEGTQIFGDVAWYYHIENLTVKVWKAKLKLSWRNDWRKIGQIKFGEFECEYHFPEKIFAGGYEVRSIEKD